MMARLILLLALAAVAACAKEEVPLFVTQERPEIPAECAGDEIPTPTVPGGGKRPVTEAEAARDRNALADGLETVNKLRATCNERLQALLGPDLKKGGKP
jgi:hypothetical protein